MPKRVVPLIVFLLMLQLIPSALAQPKKHALRISGRASLYVPPAAKNAEGSSVMLGLGANYRFAENLEADASLEWTTYKVPAGNETLIPATLNIIYNFLPASSTLKLYTGGGLGYYTTILNNLSTSTLGYQLLAGVGFTPGGDFELRAEAKYSVADTSKPSEGGWSIGAGVSGAMAMEF